MKKKPWSTARTLTLIACLILIMGGAVYIAQWEQTRARIERENAMWSALYMAQSETPSPTITSTNPAAPTITATPAPTPASTKSAAPSLTAAPSATAAPTASAENSAVPTASQTPVPTPEAALDVTIAPLATADESTLIYALETPPPKQNSFADLMALNPDVVGFLHLDDVLSLPVVQRANDNEFYLSHSFNLEESIAGTLFLDGSNLLVPEDPCLIIYGHNMRNGTMFRPLIGYEEISFLKEHPLLRFDSIYENRVYAPFAAFTVTANADSERYLNIRQFDFDEDSWDDFIDDMRALSLHDIPVDVAYGDHVLLLVTCEYTHNNGRFVVALRALRDQESENQLVEQVRSAHAK